MIHVSVPNTKSAFISLWSHIGYSNLVIPLFCQIALLFDINIVLTLPWWPAVTIVQSDITIVATCTWHDYLFCHCPLVSIMFEILRHFICTYYYTLLAVHSLGGPNGLLFILFISFILYRASFSALCNAIILIQIICCLLSFPLLILHWLTD